MPKRVRTRMQNLTGGLDSRDRAAEEGQGERKLQAAAALLSRPGLLPGGDDLRVASGIG